MSRKELLKSEEVGFFLKKEVEGEIAVRRFNRNLFNHKWHRQAGWSRLFMGFFPI